MVERRAYSRQPRKALTKEEREKLVAELVGENQSQDAEPTSQKDAPLTLGEDEASALEPDPFDAFDALDAKAMESTEQSEVDSGKDAPHEAAQRSTSQLDTGNVEEAGVAAERRYELGSEIDDHETVSPSPMELGSKQTSRVDVVDTPGNDSPPENPSLQNKLRAAYKEAPGCEPVEEPVDKWDLLDVVPVDVPHLERNLVITASRNEPAHAVFDVLRTRLVQTLLEHGWKRVAITSPSRNCGKTFTAVNLAISLSRYEASRTILLDLDMRNPSVAEIIGDTRPGKMGDFLRGVVPPDDALVRFDHNDLNIGPSLAIGTNDVIEPYAAELAQEPSTGESLDRMMAEMSPDIVLFDMPPALAFDDVIAFRPHFDGILMVVGGGETQPEEVREVMRRLGEDVPLLGVVLNQAEGEDGTDYSYGYGH